MSDLSEDAWRGVSAYGRLTPTAGIVDLQRAARLRSPAALWQPLEPVSVASGTAAVSETTVSLPAGAIAAQSAVAVVYRLTMAVGGGGKAKLEVGHRAGGAAVGAAESSNAMGAGSTSQVIADWNGGRCTYVVTFTSSPTSVVWDISVVGFLRAA